MRRVSSGTDKALHAKNEAYSHTHTQTVQSMPTVTHTHTQTVQSMPTVTHLLDTQSCLLRLKSDQTEQRWQPKLGHLSELREPHWHQRQGFGNWMQVCFGCVQAFADSPPFLISPSAFNPWEVREMTKTSLIGELDVKLLIKMDMSVFNTEIYMMLGFIESFCI